MATTAVMTAAAPPAAIARPISSVTKAIVHAVPSVVESNAEATVVAAAAERALRV
jgi:hypothetical protein